MIAGRAWRTPACWQWFNFSFRRMFRWTPRGDLVLILTCWLSRRGPRSLHTTVFTCSRVIHLNSSTPFIWHVQLIILRDTWTGPMLHVRLRFAFHISIRDFKIDNQLCNRSRREKVTDWYSTLTYCHICWSYFSIKKATVPIATLRWTLVNWSTIFFYWHLLFTSLLYISPLQTHRLVICTSLWY